MHMISLIFSSIFISIIMAQDENTFESNFTMPESCETGYQTNDWKDCANDLSTLIWNSHTWYDNEPIRICKLECSRKLKGRVSNYQWVWDAKFQCEEHAPGIIGETRGFQVRKNAMQHAIAQTIEQAIASGKLTPNDFKCD